jgi:ParB family chromosome partitioning protein
LLSVSPRFFPSFHLTNFNLVFIMQKKSLGKGLDALISGASRRWDVGSQNAAAGLPPVAVAPAEVDANATLVEMIAIANIVSSPMQPRKTFRDEHLNELMESIREHGLIQPLIVRKVHGKMELIAGERRFRASQKLGLTEVAVIVREASDRDVLEMALIENLQREDLNPMEEAEAYCRLAKEFNMKQEDIAQRVGKNRATVANSMRLMDLAPDVKSLLAQGRISTGHAKAILGLRDHALQNLIADQVVRGNFTVRQTEKHVQAELEGKPKTVTNTNATGATKPTKQHDPHIAKIQNCLRDRFGTHVAVTHGDKKGKIEIEYYGNEDLSRLLEVFGVQLN